ncbi:MAG: hypothetical protein ACRCX2_09950 [Paraclostridium sp.]
MKKITKSTVKSIVGNLKEGEKVTVTMYPSKANVLSIWFSGIAMTITNEGEGKEELLSRLDKYINEFEYYNCNNQVGIYAHYYID